MSLHQWNKRLLELSVLTKEKLHHYLAFECPIREIVAVSDRHCLATDRPRTCTQWYQSLLYRFTRWCVLFTRLFILSIPVSSFSLALSLSFSFSFSDITYLLPWIFLLLWLVLFFFLVFFTIFYYIMHFQFLSLAYFFYLLLRSIIFSYVFLTLRLISSNTP